MLLLSSLQSCKTQVEGGTVLPSQAYESCCGSQPVEFTLGNAYVYLPNSFTPNGDGTNDWFMPFISGDAGEIQEFTILSAEGDTVLFQRPTFDYSRISMYAWDGMRKDGSAYKGLFKYGMRLITKQGKLKIVEGQACCIRCGPDTKFFQNKRGCFYPVQVNADGRLDSKLSTRESGCFN